MRDVILRNPNLACSTISGVLSNLEGRYIAGADVSDETVSLVQQILRGEAVNVPGVTTRMATQEETMHTVLEQLRLQVVAHATR